MTKKKIIDIQKPAFSSDMTGGAILRNFSNEIITVLFRDNSLDGEINDAMDSFGGDDGDPEVSLYWFNQLNTRF